MINKLIFGSSVLLASLVSHGAYDYWCEPVKPMRGLEAVLVRDTNGQKELAIYTESVNFGAVDETLVKVTAENRGSLAIYSTAGTALTINKKDPMLLTGAFVHEPLNIEADMICETND